MNANERRNHLMMVAASLLDHVGDQIQDFGGRMQDHGPRNWRGVCDLEAAVDTLAALVARMSNHAMTRDDARAAAEECVSECKA